MKQPQTKFFTESQFESYRALRLPRYRRSIRQTVHNPDPGGFCGESPGTFNGELTLASLFRSRLFNALYW
jgi:hypothetical protein